MTAFVTLPKEVEAIRFTGENWQEVSDFCGTRRAGDNEDWIIYNFNPVGTYSMQEDAEALAELWVAGCPSWVAVRKDSWIVKDPDLGCFVLDQRIFNLSYRRKDEVRVGQIEV